VYSLALRRLVVVVSTAALSGCSSDSEQTPVEVVDVAQDAEVSDLNDDDLQDDALDTAEAGPDAPEPDVDVEDLSADSQDVADSVQDVVPDTERDAGQPVPFPPSLEVAWTATGEKHVFSSPRLVHIDDDGVLDIIFGTGVEKYVVDEEANAIVALSGATGEPLWTTPARYELVGTATLGDLNNDGIEDAVIGGRNGELLAVSTHDGSVIWQWETGSNPLVFGWLNFSTPQIIADRNGDGYPEVVATNGGNGAAPPFEPRPAGELLLLSGADGAILWRGQMPDGAETYMTPLVHNNGQEDVLLVGTGGETLPGSLWSLPLASFDAAPETAEWQLVLSGDGRGIMAPPVLADLNNDGILDIVVSAFLETTTVVDGATYEPLWAHRIENHESYTTPGIGYFDGDDVPDVFVCYMRGVYPTYTGGAVAVLSGVDGTPILEQPMFEYFPWNSAITLDLDQGGRTDVLIAGSATTGLADTPNTADLWMYRGETNEMVLLREMPGTSMSTPAVADLDGDGRIELIAASFQGFFVRLEGDGYWQVERVDLGEASPTSGVFGYLGQNSESTFPGTPQRGYQRTP
jgi:outer membrane protein assembly factor BamB